MSLFGSTTAKPSLFGATGTNTGGSSLFGATNNTTTAPQQSTGLFGAPQQQQQQKSSLFGASQTNTPANTSLFGAQPQPIQPAPGALSAGLAASTGGAFNTLSQRQFAQSRLQSIGLQGQPYAEKSVQEQVVTLQKKWDPASPDTLLQKYLYNAVNPAYAPFYHPGPGENEREWETALSNKPAGDENTAYIPLQIRGFEALGQRIEFQAKTLNHLRATLHEMNNSLAAILTKHQQDISVRIEETRRQHTAIAQRTLRLAIKCQVLRNRGYALDATEEQLRRNILELESKVLSPTFQSREEEIWARMVALRDRVRWLEEEGKRAGAAVDAQKQGGTQVSENVIAGANRILQDYDGQLVHLAKEMEEVRKEYEIWERERRV
jgi:nuclear pore complex protein Nup54